MKLKGKLIISFLLAALVPVIAIFFITFFGFSNIFLDASLGREHYDVLMKQRHVYSFLDGSEGDVLFLSELSSLDNLINSELSEEYLLAKQSVRSDFLNFSQKNDVYYQVRYLDEYGQEIIRVDNNGEEAYLVSESKLQNKVSRYYFKDALKVEVGDVLVSPLDLNVENGIVENRGTADDPEYVPVLRYYTPVSNQKGENKGVVVTNIYADYFLSDLDATFSGLEGGQIFLVNNEGYYLHHKDKAKEWSFMFDNQDYKLEYCDDLDSFLQNDSNQVFDVNNNTYCTFLKVYPNRWSEIKNFSGLDTVNKDDFWVIISRIDKTGIYKEMYSTFINVLMSTLLLIALIGLLIVLLFRLIFVPIKRLTEGVRIMSKGNLDYRVKIKNKDEIGELADEFNKMARSIKKSKENIEAKVKKRTEDLQKLNQSMVGRELKMIELKKKIKEKK